MRAVWTWVALCGLSGCDPEAKLCHERMTNAQAIVTQVDSKSIPSVEQSLGAVKKPSSAANANSC